MVGIDISGICPVAPTVGEQWQIALGPRHNAAGPVQLAITAVGYARWLFVTGDENAGRHAIEYAVTAFEQGGIVTDESSLEQDVLASARLIREAEPEAEGFLIRQRETASHGLSRLDDEQRRVLEYVRAGLRTKDIAQRLFLSVRSVELRLTAIYRLLGVRSRRELLTLLSEQQ
nr:LuxR C-terminal-related transcriptional regulator [Pseudoclavibacter sp. 13-3]